MVTFTGTYEDEFGPEALLWQIERTQDESEATGPVHPRLDLRIGDEVRNPDEFLVLSAVVEGRRHDVEMSDFENLRDLEDELPATRLKCCGTCRFGSYGLGDPLFGLRCHRDDREGFAIAAQHPVTRWMARPTELVPDTHHCGQYERGDYVENRVRPRPG